jgi:hypothetical protein
MRLNTSKFLTAPLGLAAMLAACSGGEMPTSPEQPSFVQAPSSDAAHLAVAGAVRVCAFFGEPGAKTATFTTTSATGTVTTPVTLSVPGAECATVWTGSTGTVTVNMTSAGQTVNRIRTFYLTNGPADVDEQPPVDASVTATIAAGNGAVFWYKLDGAATPPPPPPPPPPAGGEGCTPGYWKQSQHFGSWKVYTPDQTFQSVFGSSVFGSKTLLQVLGQGGGGVIALGRHTVAALLNTANAGVDYDIGTPAEVITAFNAAVAGGKNAIEAQHLIFAGFNEQGCPLN